MLLLTQWIDGRVPNGPMIIGNTDAVENVVKALQHRPCEFCNAESVTTEIGPNQYGVEIFRDEGCPVLAETEEA